MVKSTVEGPFIASKTPEQAKEETVEKSLEQAFQSLKMIREKKAMISTQKSA